jgi:hypothetical protein
MVAMTLRKSVVVLTITLMATSVSILAAQAQDSMVDTAAVHLLKRMTDYMSGLKQFSVHTQNTLEDQLESGQRIDFDIGANVVVSRPNKLHSERAGELIHQDFYYDGKTMTLYSPVDRIYTTQPAPGTIEEVLDYVREDLDLVFPVSDLVYRNAFAILMESVTSAVVVGQTNIGGITCNHLAFRRPDVDFQVWIAADDLRPLPCKYVVTDTSTPELISTVSVMSDWNVAPMVTNADFEFIPPDGVQAISDFPMDETFNFDR